MLVQVLINDMLKVVKETGNGATVRQTSVLFAEMNCVGTVDIPERFQMQIDAGKDLASPKSGDYLSTLTRAPYEDATKMASMYADVGDRGACSSGPAHITRSRDRQRL